MRLYEFATDQKSMLYTTLKTLAGRAESKGQPAKYNWGSIQELVNMKMDYQVFDQIYQADERSARPILAPLVHDYNSDGIELNVPGAPDSNSKEAKPDSEKAQDNVNKTAASAAMNNISS